MKQTYIALDLETTGFDPETDEVLEIAAIKFKGDKILETFQTLIKPTTDIPAMVSHITSITAETVKNAPSFEDIRENLSIFIGNLPIIGHNIEFDLTFLEAKGIPILNRQLDTLKLSSILISNLPSYSLDTISRRMGIIHKHKHRAYSDALVCVKLFNLLIERIKLIPQPLLNEIRDIASRGNWDLADIFNQTNSSIKNSEQSKKLKNTKKTNLKNKSIAFNNFQHGDITELLGNKSPLSDILKKYEYRPGQQTLFLKILEAENNNYNLIAEAGTGTGKTMAYLFAAACLRQNTGKKTIISTHTNHLQDQIVEKEFPIIQKLFPNLTISVLKGRSKYLDPNKLDILKRKKTLEEHEISALIKILLWSKETQNGDLDELNLQNKEIIIYDQICSNPEKSNKSKDKQDDYLTKARKKAEESDIIIINHSLLVQDSLIENSILPHADILIIDEAHNLEKTITEAKTVNLSESRLHKLWENLFEIIFKYTNTGIIVSNEWRKLIEELKEEKQNCLNELSQVFQILEDSTKSFTTITPGMQIRLHIDEKEQNHPKWQKIIELLTKIENRFQDITKLFKQLNNLCENIPNANEQINHIIYEIEKFFLSIQSFTNKEKKQITWIGKNFDNSINLVTAPLAIDKIFNEKVTSPYSTVILTSATLSTYGNFNYLRNELGLDENYEQILIPSHFNYPDNVKLIIPEDLSDPRDNDYLNQCKQIISAVIQKNNGRSLVLFTAKKDLAYIFHNLASPLKETGFDLLAQNISGGRGKIIAHFQDEPEHSAILGTNSFWEGVDLIGPVLTCVIIQKLPFDPPDDPIIKARSANFQKPFEQYSMPRAILRFKQGFGRLIRSANDTGAVIVLDSRLVKKSYGQEFLSSLPPGIQIHQCASANVQDFI